MTDSERVVRVRLDFSYDGTGFSGWAAQPGLRTVEGEMGAAFGRLLREASPRITVAGRTDAGVHARGQVAHLDIGSVDWARLPGRSSRSPEVALLDRLEGVLPHDIVVRAVSIAPGGFDARFSATERRYAYRLSDAIQTRDPLARNYVVWHPRALSLEALNRASSTLTGLRDYVAFCRPRERATTIRTLTEFSWERPGAGPDAGLVVATVRADAFCHSMVRSLVGAVLAVGEGRRDLEWLATMAASTARTPRIAVAPPHGLTLEAVTYPPDAELAARAEATRAHRSLD